MAKATRSKTAPVTSAADNQVARQYEKWVYPLPIQDLSTPEARKMRDGGDFERNFYSYWPDQEKREDLDVLIAGCGSNAAARYAFHHPQARVVGIDLSASSLAHEQYLKDKHNLTNLTLHQGKIEDVVKLGQTFDFIDTSGVLHHLPDPVAGLKALGSVLRPEGTIAVMVYAKYGRSGVYMMQEAFRLMNLGQSEEDVKMVKRTLNKVARNHAVHDYIARSQDLKYDAGIVDTFLHPQDRAYTTNECVEFVQQAGLSFMGWWDNIFYYPEAQLSDMPELFNRVNQMSEKDMWQFMELYNGTVAKHAFRVCLPSRDASTYQVNFNGADFLDYTPVLRSRIVETPQGAPAGAVTLKRDPYPAFTLNTVSSAMVKHMDGTKTVRACYEAAGLNPENMEQAARGAMQTLWRLSYVFLKFPSKKDKPKGKAAGKSK